MGASDPLVEYRAKRTASATPEPPGEPPPDGADGPVLRFVVQEHHARSLHWDLRLEHEGVLWSWAVPKGLPADPRTDHLAVRTEDHPLEYLTFHGEIPAGQYGAGTMTIWDTGTYELVKATGKEVQVVLHGERVQGVRFALVRTRGKDWLLHRMSPPQDPGRELLPEALAPMLACPGTLPPEREDGRWAYEVKWDGVRALAFVAGGRVTLRARSGRDITKHWPEVRGLGADLGTTECVLDGEVIVTDPAGRPDFGLVQQRMHLASEGAIKRRARDLPATYVVFDCVWLDGRSLEREPYRARREALAGLGIGGAHWQAPAHHVGQGAALLAATRERGLEGVVAKQLDSPYVPGKRSSCWVKVKNTNRTEVVVGGWIGGQGGRGGRIGALAVGTELDDGTLRYAGKVGTGFTEAELERLAALLGPLATDASPFTGRQPQRGTRFVRPEHRCVVEYVEWTRTGTLRAPSYKGLAGA